MTALVSSATPSNDPYVSMSDEAELERLNKLYAAQGLGGTLDDGEGTDEDLQNLMSDFGVANDHN